MIHKKIKKKQKLKIAKNGTVGNGTLYTKTALGRSGISVTVFTMRAAIQRPEIEAEVFQGLCPPLEIQRLEITDHHGSRYPDWMIGGHKGPKYLRLNLLNFSFIFVHSVFGKAAGTYNLLPDNLEQLMSLHELKMYF